MKRFISWSGGKDSTASIIICHEQGIPIGGVVMSEVMFDHSRNISGEHPEHIKWVYEVAIPKIERDFGYKVIVLKSESDYVQEFYHKIGTRTKHKDRVGKYAGFFLGGLCVGNDRLKMQPLRKFFKEQGEHEQIVGIAVDEPKRLARLTSNKRSVLAEFGVTEKDALELCKKYDLLSPTYNSNFRGGCWFCPNSKIAEFAKLKQDHPELWGELKKLSKEKNLTSKMFCYGKTFDEIERKVDMINNQITMWEERDMAREILFRAKREDNGEWVYGTPTKVSKKTNPCIVESLFEYDEYACYGAICHEVDENTICEYTGLKDKNGTKIFEGDIIRLCKGYGEEAEVGCVIYKKGGFVIDEIYSGDGYNGLYDVLSEYMDGDDVYNSWVSCEVIGNKFDNDLEVKDENTAR